VVRRRTEEVDRGEGKEGEEEEEEEGGEEVLTHYLWHSKKVICRS